MSNKNNKTSMEFDLRIMLNTDPKLVTSRLCSSSDGNLRFNATVVNKYIPDNIEWRYHCNKYKIEYLMMPLDKNHNAWEVYELHSLQPIAVKPSKLEAYEFIDNHITLRCNRLKSIQYALNMELSK